MKSTSFQLSSSFSDLTHAGHSGKPNAIVEDAVDLSVRQVLRVGQTRVRGLRIKILADFGLSAAFVTVANGTAIGEVSPRVAEKLQVSAQTGFSRPVPTPGLIPCLPSMRHTPPSPTAYRVR
jgi:hypothetical protein